MSDTIIPNTNPRLYLASLDYQENSSSVRLTPIIGWSIRDTDNPVESSPLPITPGLFGKSYSKKQLSRLIYYDAYTEQWSNGLSAPRGQGKASLHSYLLMLDRLERERLERERRREAEEDEKAWRRMVAKGEALEAKKPVPAVIQFPSSRRQ